MSLISPSRSTMQKLLDLCTEYCTRFCLKFNVKKTKVMIFGKLASDLDVLACLQINGMEIEFVRSYRYLGFHVISDSHFKFSSSECLRGFFGAVNCVLSVLRRPRENILMELLYSNCVPKRCCSQRFDTSPKISIQRSCQQCRTAHFWISTVAEH